MVRRRSLALFRAAEKQRQSVSDTRSRPIGMGVRGQPRRRFRLYVLNAKRRLHTARIFGKTRGKTPRTVDTRRGRAVRKFQYHFDMHKKRAAAYDFLRRFHRPAVRPKAHNKRNKRICAKVSVAGKNVFFAQISAGRRMRRNTEKTRTGAFAVSQDEPQSAAAATAVWTI